MNSEVPTAASSTGTTPMGVWDELSRNSPHGLLITTAAGVPLELNASMARMAGFQFHEMPLQPVQQLWAWPIAFDIHSRHESLELKLPRPDGSTISVRVSIFPISGERIAVIVRDVTQEHTSVLLSDALARMMHHLNGANDSEQAGRICLEAIHEMVPWAMGFVALLASEHDLLMLPGHQLVPACLLRRNDEAVIIHRPSNRMLPSHSATKRALDEGPISIHCGLAKESICEEELSPFDEIGTGMGRSHLFVPILAGSGTAGVIGLRSEPGTRWGVREKELVSRFANASANAMSRVRVEQEARLLRTAVHHASDMVVITASDPQSETGTSIVYVNQAFERITGFSRGEVLGRSVRVLQGPETNQNGYREIRTALERSEPVTVEITNFRKDGRPYSVEISTFPLPDETSSMRYFVSVQRDVTERRKAEDERRRIEAHILQTQKLESLGVLAGGIAHDFNNLLVGVLGNADLAKDDLPPGSPARESINEIEIAARRAADLCRQMLAYSGRGKFHIEAINLNVLVQEMAHLMEISIAKKISVRYQFLEDLPAIETDSTQIRQIVMNLITNAAEAIGEKPGVITVATGVEYCSREYLSSSYLDEQLPAGDYVFLEVTDSGCGMDAETKDRMFDPFFTTKFTGRGLGLAAVLGIVRSHHGAVRVESLSGEGTSFRILLPILPEAAAAVMRESAGVGDWRGDGLILVVDDEATVRLVAARMLQKCGFSVLTAADGREALEMLSENSEKISAVLLDIAMPEADGEEVMRALSSQWPELPVLMISGFGELEVSERLKSHPHARILQKPFDLATLLARLREVLEEAGKR